MTAAITGAWWCASTGTFSRLPAAIAFGCNVETMKKHYIRKDRLAEADAVFARIQAAKSNGSPPESTANNLLTDSNETTEIGHELVTVNGNGDGAAKPSNA